MSPGRLRLTFALLYFSEGAPIGWLWWALPSKLSRAGVEVDAITGLLAALAVPWTLKFVWAPLLDVARGPRFGLRAWLVLAQFGMAATLVPLLWIDPVQRFEAAFWLLLAHAFCAATQDVAIDALAIRSVPATQHGSLNGAMQIGMIGGRILLSSGLLWLSARTGEGLAVPLMLGVLMVASVVVLTIRFDAGADRPVGGGQAAGRLRSRSRRYLKALLAAPRFWRLVAFALLGGAAFEAAGALSGPWLVRSGLDDDGIATFRLASAALMAAGAFFAGRLVDRHGAARITSRAALMIAGVVGLIALSGSVIVYALLYAAIGALTAASYALFMRTARGPFAATVFSGFMGLTNGCEAWAAAVAGGLAVRLGTGAGDGENYGGALLAMLVVAVPAILLVRRGPSLPR